MGENSAIRATPSPQLELFQDLRGPVNLTDAETGKALKATPKNGKIQLHANLPGRDYRMILMKEK